MPLQGQRPGRDAVTRDAGEQLEAAARRALAHDDAGDHEPPATALEKSLARTFLENFIGGLGFVAGGVAAVLLFGALVR